MTMFEEVTWDAAPAVNKLDDGLFGKVESNNKKPEGEGRTPVKLKRGQRGQRGPTERSTKWKNREPKTNDESNDANSKSEGGVRTPAKHKRGKRGKNKWKKRGDEEAAEKGSQKDENQTSECKKKLKLKLKAKQGKVTLPTGKSPRNKYKHMAIMREKQLNSSNSKDTENQVDKSKTETPHEMTFKKSKQVKEQTQHSIEAAEVETQTGKTEKGKKSKIDTQETDTPEVSELGTKKAKKRKVKVVATQQVIEDEVESINNSASQKRNTKKRKENLSVLACTPVESKGKRKKTTEAMSEGLFTKVENSDGDASSSEDTQPEPSTRKRKKKEKLIQPPLEDTNEPAKKKKKKNQLKTENSSVDTNEPAKKKKKNQLKTESLSEDTNEPAKKKKKKKLKTKSTGDIEDDSFADDVDSNPSPQMKSPFHIGKLKNVLDRKSTECEVVSGKKRKSEVLEGSPKAKSKKSEPLSLRERMQAQLSGARFRFINEQLYTCTGEEALQLMQTDPDAFKVYHDGFTSQVEKWPENPVNRIIKFVKARPDAVVADMGCGDAKLAQSVPNKVHSFDLVAVNEYITVCDIAQLPLADGSVDVAVFCLSLMGTNFVDFICEANRALKTGGTLVIAEVVSRFEKVGAFIRKMVKLGFDLSKKDDSNKMFIWFEFTKTSEAPSAERRPHLELTPCIYKKR